MKLGLFGINLGLFAVDHRAAVEVARAAEEAGWERVWAGEHFALPDPPTPASPGSAEGEEDSTRSHAGSGRRRA